MQNKGLIRFLAVLLALVCAFYLSFSFVTSHYNKKAVELANGDKTVELQVLDSLASQKVWFGYNLKECREKEINFGLDLKGGMNVTLEVSVPEILNALSGYNTSENYTAAVKLAKERQKNSQDDFLTLFFKAYYEIDPNAQLASVFSTFELKDKVTLNSTNSEVEKVIKEEVEGAINNSFNVLRTRIDRFGVVQPNIQRMEEAGRILIELPGIKEPERVRKLLQGTANLEFWETFDATEVAGAFMSLDAALAQLNVEDSLAVEHPLLYALNASLNSRGPVVGTVHWADTAKVMAMLTSQQAKAILPRDLKLCWTVKAIDDAESLYHLVALKQVNRDGRASLEGDVITDANADFSQTSAYANVSMEMNAEGAKAWARITKENIGKSIAIVLDGYVYSFPTVQNEITGGRSQITGNFTVDEAKDLANTLKSGKMPAPARIIQEDVVGPSLGQEAINAGMISFIIAFCLVLLYMIFYYGLIPGLIADAALLCNVFLLLGILASFGSVLTLPGMAGIVLTMGMAVDANVLIYERIREEIIAGKGLRKAIEDGFSGAVSAIIDSNVTSFLTGVVLAIFGTGPIRGFAITYMIGIVSSFMTAVFLTRLMLDDYAKREDAKPLQFTTKITANWFRNTAVKFISLKKYSYITAGVVIIIGIMGLIPSFFGHLNFGIDFTGGRNYVVRFENPVSTDEIQSNLVAIFNANAEEGENCAVNVITFGQNNQVRISTNFGIKSEDENMDKKIEALIYEAVGQYLPEDMTADNIADISGLGIIQSQKVGPSIADDIKTSAVWAVLAALVIIFLYILMRFRDFAYSVGAIVALAHDTIVILGLYALLWHIMPFSMEIDQSFIAAILTIIGYSINDTVVVFDRIRENTKLYPTRSLMQNMDDSVNQTLSRTFSTSLSTFLVLLAIFCFGGESIRGFVFALLMGVIVGTFSTIFIASPIAHDIKMLEAKRKAKKATTAKATVKK